MLTTFKSLIYLLLFTATVFSYSCKNNPTTTTTSASEPKAVTTVPTFQQKTTEKKIGDCTGDEDCLEVTVTYPLLSGVNDTIQKLINDAILEEVIMSMEIEEEVTLGPSAIENATQQWVDAFKEYLNEDLQHRVAFTYQLNGKGSLYKNYAVTELPYSTFTGGAHPNYAVLFSNYNLNDGTLIDMEDIVIDSLAFKKIVESSFEKEAKKKESGMEIGDFFWGKPFYLPANFAITEKGLHFVYNPYEIAPYAFGSTEFTVLYADLEGLISLP